MEELWVVLAYKRDDRTKLLLKPVDVKGDKQRNRVKKVNINKLNEKRSFRQCGFRMPI